NEGLVTALETEQDLQQVSIEKLQNDKKNIEYKLGIHDSRIKNKEDYISELQQQDKQLIEKLQKQLDEETEKYQNSQTELKNKEDYINELQQQNKQRIEELQKQLDEETKKYHGIKEKLLAIYQSE